MTDSTPRIINSVQTSSCGIGMRIASGDNRQIVDPGVDQGWQPQSVFALTILE